MHRTYRDLYRLPKARDSRIDRNVFVEVNTTVPRTVLYHDNALYISNYFYSIEGNKTF